MKHLTEKNKIIDEINFGEGAVTSEYLNYEELQEIRGVIKKQWIARIKAISPEHVEKFEAIQLDEYHTLSHLLDHKKMWPKSERILPYEDLKKFRETKFFSRLEEFFGPFLISNEEGKCTEEAYWRLVRPNVLTDVGPLHADKWFWDLSDVVIPEGYTRIKIWIAIFCEKGMNGFVYSPGSQKKKYSYSGEFRDGKIKPKPNFDMSKLDVITFNSEPGQAIIFHDELIHGGRVGGESTRVSLEFTIMTK